MKFPLIGITASTNSKAEDRLPAAYSSAVQAAGGAPLLIPINFPLQAVPDLIGKLDGLLLSGGGDIDPSCYPAKAPDKCEGILPARDRLEFELLKFAEQKGLAVLGICRGMQVINVFRGGTLYTDLPSQYSTRLVHNTADDLGRDYLAHQVTIESGSLLRHLLGKSSLPTNSFHHQAVMQTGNNLQVSAHASDGLVEALEDPTQKFFVAVQWHPECLQDHEPQKRLFRAFIQAAQA